MWQLVSKPMTTKSSALEALREQVAWLKTIVGGCDASSILSARVVEIIEELEVRCKLI